MIGNGHNANTGNTGGAGDAGGSGGAFALPAGVGEEVVLAWVDGELDGAEQARLAREHPGLARLVRGMRDDARRIGTLPFAQAPIDMPERVTTMLEREALLGMERSAAGEAEPPRMRITTARRAPAWAPRLAIAAGFVLLAGGTAFLARVAYQSLPARPPIGPVAINDSPANRLMSPEAREAFAGTLAKRTDATGELGAGTIGADVASASVAGTPSEGGESLAEREIAAAAEGPALRVASAVELAREGRLMIRVRTREASPLGRLATQSSRVWRVVGDSPAGVALALATPSANHAAPRERDESPTIIAGDAGLKTEGPFDARMKTSIAAGPAPVPAAAPVAITLEIVPEQGAIDGVLGMLRGAARSRTAEVTFEALPPGVTLEDLGLVREQAAQDLLWWTKPVDAWAPRVLVPVVLEAE